MFEEDQDEVYKQTKRKTSAELWEESRLDYMGHNKKMLNPDELDEIAQPDDENELEVELNEKEAPFLKG